MSNIKNIYLLRGLVREARHWGDFKAKLQTAFPQAQVTTLEIKGVGKLHHQESDNNFKDMIEYMREEYYSNNDGESLLLAMSLGGMMARQWMEMYPDDFQYCVLVNTSFKKLNSLTQRIRPKSIFNFINIFLTPKLEDREDKILKMVSNTYQQRPNKAVLSDWINIQQSAPVSRKSFINQIKAALTYVPSLNKPKPKLLILAAKNDRLCDFTCSLDLHKHWGGELKIHMDAGHDIPLDDGEWIVKNIQNWA